MFTGLIQDIGHVLRIAHRGGLTLLNIGASMEIAQWPLGESVAVNGVCLTLVRAGASDFDAEISPETRQRTNLGTISSGESVNIERALGVNDRIGGHIVTGHVDAIGTITRLKEVGGAREIEISAPETIMPLLVEKGSVALDGVSLTVNTIKDNRFTVTIIPHTLSRTTLGQSGLGKQINIETDLIGKYVFRYLSQRGAASEKIDLEFLARHGFS